MDKLSPAARAVHSAFHKAANGQAWTNTAIAAALRAAADQVVPVELHPQVYEDCCQYSDVQTRAGVRAQFLAIAAELDPPP
jgi:hypothetical protein